MYNYGQYGSEPPQSPSPYYFPQDYVAPDEKLRIRKNYNAIGLTLLALYVLMEIVCSAGYAIYFAFGHDILYNEDGTTIMDLWLVFIGGGFPAIAAMIIFAFYCAITKYKPKELFSTSRINTGELIRYILIVLFFQQVSLICSMFIMSALESHGLEVVGMDYVIEHDPKAYAIDIISSIILAPIGEELIYRGIVLRQAAKVSGRFAIFFSALIFGLMHGNPYQMILGFLLGIPLAMITLKTGSIIPSIICHMVNNTIASIPTVLEYFDETAASVISIVCIPIFFIIGIIVLLISFLKGNIKFPPYTQYHKKRTLPILITSWSMIVITIIYIYDIITSIGPIEEYISA